MEGIAAMLTDEEQALVGTVKRRGMPAPWAGLTAVVGIDLDGHTLMQEGFIGDHGVQFSKRPFGIGRIRLSLLRGSLLALFAASTLPYVGQVFQAKERMRMRAHHPFTHDMIGVGFQPSLSSPDAHKSPRGGASAFLLQTLAL